MQQEKTVQLNGRGVIVKELKVKHVKRVYKEISALNEISMQNLFDLPAMQDVLPDCCEGLRAGEIDDLSVSELEQIYLAFEEVNDAFFRMPDWFLKKLRGRSETGIPAPVKPALPPQVLLKT